MENFMILCVVVQLYILLLLTPSIYLPNHYDPTNTHSFLVSGENDEVAKNDEVSKPNIVYSHDMSKQRAAVKAWSKILSEKDYNASEWARFLYFMYVAIGVECSFFEVEQ